MTGSGPAYDTYRATHHFGSLDGLRFLCIALVLWHHAPGAGAYHAITPLFSRGHVGVDFFFVLSGFLITTLLLREAARNGHFSLRGFYWRRILRIVPVYFLVVSLAAFNDIVLNGETDKIGLLPYYFLFLSNFLIPEHISFLHPTWSLAMEEQYYLVWPLLLLILPARWRLPVLAALIAINVCAAMGLFDLVGIRNIVIGDLKLMIGGATYAPILMGTVAAIILHSRAGFAALRQILSPRTMPWILLAVLIVALALLPKSLEGLPNLLVHGVMTLLLICLVLREDNGMAPILRLGPLRRIGQISYGIYLYHLFARAVITKLFALLGWSGVGLSFLAYGALSVLIAEISFRTYEAWFLNLRHRPAGQTR